jgi:putative transposase
MNSHVHLFLQPSAVFSLSRTMHAINKGYALHHNKEKKRTGHFWVDRYKNIPVQDDEHALALMRYINRNAVRAGMVEKPGDWKFSGYRFYAFGESNDLLEYHPSFLALSNSHEARRREYRDLVNQSWPGDQKRQLAFSESLYLGSTSFGKKLGFEK